MEYTGSTASLAKKCVCRVKITDILLGQPDGYTKKVALRTETHGKKNTTYGMACDTQNVMTSPQNRLVCEEEK